MSETPREPTKCMHAIGDALECVTEALMTAQRHAADMHLQYGQLLEDTDTHPRSRCAAELAQALGDLSAHVGGAMGDTAEICRTATLIARGSGFSTQDISGGDKGD